MPDYIKWLRGRVGHVTVQFNFAAACVLDSDGVLLQRRGDDGMWGLPGGAIELGESAEEAVLREVLEETGIRVQVTNLIGIYTKYCHSDPNGDVAQPITTFFRCTPLGGHARRTATSRSRSVTSRSQRSQGRRRRCRSAPAR